jgi:hypothetical protein
MTGVGLCEKPRHRDLQWYVPWLCKTLSRWAVEDFLVSTPCAIWFSFRKNSSPNSFSAAAAADIERKQLDDAIGAYVGISSRVEVLLVALDDDDGLVVNAVLLAILAQLVVPF